MCKSFFLIFSKNLDFGFAATVKENVTKSEINLMVLLDSNIF